MYASCTTQFTCLCQLLYIVLKLYANKFFFLFFFSSLLPPSFNWNKLDHRNGEVMLKDALVNSQIRSD